MSGDVLYQPPYCCLWCSFVCAPSVHVYFLVCAMHAVCPFCHYKYGSLKHPWLPFCQQQICDKYCKKNDACCAQWRNKMALPGEKRIYSLITCNVVLISHTGTNSQYLMFRQKQGLQLYLRSLSVSLYCSSRFVPVKWSYSLSRQRVRHCMYFTSIRCSNVTSQHHAWGAKIIFDARLTVPPLCSY